MHRRSSTPSLPTARDKILFTPGPLTTSLTVKQAMLRDAGSWHYEFNELVARIRDQLLAIAGVSVELGYEAILMQGSGTFGVESVISSVLPPKGKLLVLANGAYGERIVQMAGRFQIPTTALRSTEDQTPSLNLLDEVLQEDPEITHVAAVHCETTTGIVNPITEIGAIVQRHRRCYIVDAMSSFGAMPIDLRGAGIHYLISSANKCLEGVPGFSFILAGRESLLATEGYARTLSLDLLGQWKGFQKNGQFRYSPPTHSILAFRQALNEFELEGGIPARAERYRRNHEQLMAGMRAMGFRSYLDPSVQSYIITSFYFPEHPHFEFNEFYRRLSDKGFIIYPGKISHADLFRIGSIGRIFESDVRALLAGIRSVLEEMEIEMPRHVESIPAHAH